MTTASVVVPTILLATRLVYVSRFVLPALLVVRYLQRSLSSKLTFACLGGFLFMSGVAGMFFVAAAARPHALVEYAMSLWFNALLSWGTIFSMVYDIYAFHHDANRRAEVRRELAAQILHIEKIEANAR